MHTRLRCGRASTFLCILLASAAAVTGCERQHQLILASTTSTLDSGLLDVLVPAFEQEYDQVRVRVIAVGSGEALALGRRGDADVLLVHSPADEDAFMEDGSGERRIHVMTNDYIIAGPPSDPAGVRGLTDVAEALRRIAAAGAPFVSRGDGSGTHRREQQLWRESGVDDAVRMEIGQGMGEALTIASERSAYLLTDRGTWLALAENLHLENLVSGDARMLNRYSVITVRGAHNAADADRFADWLTAPAATALIRTFGVADYGQPLFVPAASRVH